MEEEFHNRNSRRIREHLSVSVDNEEPNVEELKIDASESEESKLVRIFSGPGEKGRLHRAPNTRARLKPPLDKEPKNEILSRTFAQFFQVRNLLRVCVCLLAMSLTMGASAEALATRGRAVDSLSKDVTNNRTFKGERPAPRPRARAQKKALDKNCKEYDVTSRAYLADLIFEGTARSGARRESGRHVTFVIQEILKQESNLLKPKTQIRLRFGGKGSRRLVRVNPLKDCPLTSVTSGNRAVANVRIGENYYVFADRFGPSLNYRARGEPIVANRRNLKSIRSVLSIKKEKPPRILGLQDLNLKTTQQLRLNCQVRGKPVPRINWFKDGSPIIPSSHVNVTYYRRNSTIEIKSVELKDRGVYECRATSVTGKTANASAHVDVWKVHAASTTDPVKSYHMKKCPVDAYCLNGGLCHFIENLGEHMCECSPGFTGPRCENKEVLSIDARQPMDWPDVGTASP